MSDISTEIGIGGGSGIIAVILSWFGFKYQIKNLKEKVDNIEKNVRFSDTCEKMYQGIQVNLHDIKEMQKEMRDDIKKVISQI